MSRFVSFAVLIGFIVVVGFLFYRVMAGFLLPLFAAAVLVVIFHPIYRWMLIKTRRKQLSAALTTTAIVLIVLLPVALVFTFAALEGAAVLHWNQKAVVEKKDELLQRYGLDIPWGRELCDQLVVMAGDSAEVNDRSANDNAGGTNQRPVDLLLRDTQRDRLMADFQELRERVNQSTGMLEEKAVEESAQFDRKLAKVAATQDAGKKQEIEARHTRLNALQDQWEMFSQQLAAIEVDPEEVALDDSQLEQLGQASATFAAFKADYIGSPLMIWVRDLANPTQDRFNNWIREGKQLLKKWLLNIGGATPAVAGSIIIGLLVTIVGVYFFLADGSTMVKTAMKLSPLDDSYEQELIEEFDQISRAVVLATLLSAVVQGVLAGVGFYFAGIESVFLLTLLTTVLAMIPFVGAAAVWLPTALWLYFFEDQTLAAIGLGIYGFVIVSQADNLIKPWVLHGQSRLHPLLALLSVLGGVQALGPIGILVGPMVVAFAQALMNILHRELSEFDRRHEQEQRGRRRRGRGAIVIPVEGFSTITLSGQSLRR